MAIFLRFHFQNFIRYSIKKSGSSCTKLLAALFFVAALFFSKETYATSFSFSGGSITPSSATFCAGDSIVLSFTATSVGSLAGPWTANYQWESSTDGGVSWGPIAGASGIITTASPTTTYNTSALLVTTTYRIVLTGITVSIVGSSYMSTNVTVTVTPRPVPITGNDNICVGATSCLTDATAGGTWSSTNTAVATVGTGGCVFGVAIGTANIVYTGAGGCTATTTVTVNSTLPINGPSVVCVGSTITLTDATAGVTWTSSNTLVATDGAGTGIVTGVAGGNTTIIATSPLGCVAIKTITVNPNPAGITGNKNICIGSTNCLTDATGGGTWSSSNTGVATVGTSGCVFGAATGTATISYTLSTTSCYNTATVTVNPLPAAIAGTESVCVGLTTSLSDATGGGTWSSLNTAVATINSSGTVTGVTAGTATIVYTSPLGCTISAVVTVNPLAPITGNDNICPGSTTTLSDAATGGTWSSSDITIATVGSSSGVVSSVALGTATITYSLPFGCTATTTVTVDPVPAGITGTATVCVGSSVNLTDASTGGTWSSSAQTVAIVGSGTGVVTGITAGTSTITYTLPTSCYTTYVVTVNPVSPISGTMTVCVGNITSLTDGTAGGTWSSSNTVVASVDGSGNVTGLVAGTTTISYNLVSGCSAATVVTVNPLPGAITGNLNVCAWGGTTSLTDATTGGAWSSTLVVVDLVGNVTGFDTGVGTVTYILPTGCMVTASVTVNPLPAPITGNTTVCAGYTTTLFDASPGGTWSSSNNVVGSVGSTTGVVMGLASGTTDIVYTLPTGCTADTSVLVEPAPSGITGTGSVCVGLTTALTDATTGGTWSSSDITTATVGLNSGIVTGVDATAGTATITYTLPTGCFITTVVTVNPLPTTITGPLNVCVGSTTNLTDASAGGTWASSNTAVGSVDGSGDVTGIASGTTTITYTLATGCLITTTVTVNPINAISGTPTVCYGLTTTLTDTTAGGTWSSSDITIASVGLSSGVVTGTGVAGGTVTITYILATGCSATIVVTDNPLPSGITGVATVCQGQTTALTDATAGGNWSSSNSGIATVGATGTVTGAGGGTATITYMLPTGCIATDVVTVNPLSPITGTLSVCQGSTTSLTDATTGGTWSTINTAIGSVDGFGNVYGVSGGTTNDTTTVLYSLPTGCSATAVVTVNALDPISGGNVGLCIGFTVTLSDIATGGTWSSSNTGVATVGSLTGVVTGAGAGTATITYLLPSGCSATTTITVNSMDAITGAANVCQGSTTVLSDLTPGGTWSSSNPGVGTISATGIFGGVNSGTTIVSYSYGTNCYAIFPVIVNPMTPIQGVNTVCPGLCVTLSDTTAGGTWISSNTTIATVGSSTGVVCGLEPGTVTIIYSVSTGCIATSVVTVDIVYPTTGNTSLCLGGTSTLTNITPGGTWSSSNTTVATVDAFGNVTASSINTGTSNITYTLPSGCISVVTVTVNPMPAPITGPTQVCAWGGTITLSDVTAGGAWSSTVVLIDGSGDVTALDTGVATITYQLPTGCSVYYMVTVNPLPNNINGNLIVCQGLTTTLSDPPGGGTWSSSSTGVATINSITGFVNAISSGSTIISYTLPTGCFTDTLLTVNGLPAPISGVTSVCYGLTTALTDATVGGTWSSSNTAVGSIGSLTGVVGGLSAAGGTTTITYTLPTGCIITTVVTVNPLPTSILGPGSVCAGQTITLSDLTGGGTWSSSNTTIETIGSSTGIATGVLAGVVTDTYTLGTGCIATTTVTVNALSPITGNPTLCIGLTTNLTDATAGGTWSSSNTSIAGVGSTGVVTGNGTGTATITYILPSGCTTTTVVTVNPLPGAILGTLTVCVGQTTSLSDGVGGGTWSSSNTGVATIAGTGIVTGISAGTSIITYTLGSGCIVTAIVTVNPLAPINGQTSICQTQTYVFTDAVTGGTWSSSNSGVASVDVFGNVTGVGVGTANIIYVTALGCTTSLTVTVNAMAPISGSTDLCVGVTTIFTDAVGGGIWASSNPGVATIEAITGIVGGIAPGTTTITNTLPSGCIATLIVTVNSLPAITGPSSVCQGDSINLTDATLGGVWTTSNNHTATVGSTGVVDGHNSGTAIISYSYGPSCVVVKPVNVDPSTPILGNLNICQGLTTTLTDSTDGGTWSSSNGNVSINSVGVLGGYQTVIVTGITVGTSIITYTLPTGCVQTVVVTVNMTAAISGTDSVCVGLTTALTDATTGVTWSSSASGIASIDPSTGIVTGIAQGTAIITATSPVGCIATVIVTVNPNPTPILGPHVVCVGLINCLTDATPAGTWSSSNTGVATINTATGCFTGISAGTAVITYTLPTTCITTTIITVNPLPAAISGTLAVCVNSGTLLTDASGPGTWSASNGNATIGSSTGVVIGVTAGLDTITYTLGTGCIMTAVLTVNPLPSTILGNPNVCLGSINSFSDATGGGVWSSGNPTVGSIDAEGNVTGLMLGTAIITYTLPTGCLTTLIITVDPLPLAITGVDSVCVGLTTSLSDPTFGGTWTSNNTSIATVGSSTGIVTGVNGGVNGLVDTITYTLGTGCYVTYTVTVYPLPSTILGNFNVCSGTCNTLSDATPNGVWSSSNITIATVDSSSGLVCSVTLGTATITYTLPTGCYVTQIVTVDPLPLPITGTDSVCVGFTTTLADGTPGGTWISSSGAATVGSTTGVVLGVFAGTTVISYQLIATGCIATDTVIVNGLPGIITGNSQVCVLDSVQLITGTTGGTWSSSPTSIAYVSSVSHFDTVEVVGVAAGTVNITYTLPTGCYTTFVVTVNPLPPAITGIDSVCVGYTVTLSDASVGGTWSSNPADTANFTNPISGVLTGLSHGTATVTYTSNLSCLITAVVTVNPVPNPILGAKDVCNGLTTQLSDTSPGGVWSATNTGITTIGTAGLVTGISPGTDSIYYTYPVTGCYAYVSFIVHPIPVIIPASSPNAQICIGGFVTLTASGAGPGGTYAWTPSTGLSTNVGPGPITATPTVTTTYTIVGTTQYGCSHDTTIAVHVDSLLLHIHISGKDSICEGAYDTLIATGAYIGAPLFEWSPITALSTTPADTVYADPLITTTYTATLIDSFGCHDSTTFKVTVNPLPIISVTPNPGIVCRGSTTQFTAHGASNYTWFPNAFLSCDSCANPIASDTQNLVYIVYGTSIYGCRDSIYFPVSVLDTTKITISNDTILCLGQCANLLTTSTSVDGSHPDYFSWSPTNGLNDPNIPNPTACPDTTTAYTVIIKENACFSDTSHVIVYVEPYPTIVLSASPSGTVLAGTAVQLGATISNDVLLTDYEWTPAVAISCEKCYNPIVTPTATSTYTFTATSNYGCVSSSTITINLTCGEGQVFIPNTFTPNGDGFNDRFYISGKGIGTITRLSIYNRWGELVFQSTNTNANDPAAGWDGTYKGVVLEPDVFVYVAQVTCELGGQPFDFKGDVSIVR